MKRPASTKLARADAPPDGEGARVEDVGRLIAALPKAREARMARSEVEALVRVLERACRRFEEGADPRK